MDLQELQKQYDAAKKTLEDISQQIKQLTAEGGGETPSVPVDEEPENIPADEPKPCADLESIEAKLDKISDENAAILSLLESHDLTLKDIQEKQGEKIKTIEEQSDIRQEKLEHIIQTVQEDRYRKDKLRLINRCVYQADLVRKTVYDYPELSKDIENKEEFLLRQLQSVVAGIESMLADEGVLVRNFAAVGEKINPEYQEVIGVIETDDESKNNTVAEIINPGYIWTLPYILKAKVNESGEEIKHYKFLMQTEQIIAYKYVKQQ